MSLVSVNDVLKITTRVEKIHPYKVVGNRDSYSSYNEGWSDCVSLIESYIEKLPSAEPERKKGDLISRKALLDTIKPMIGIWEEGTFYIDYERVISIIESALSSDSAQSKGERW